MDESEEAIMNGNYGVTRLLRRDDGFRKSFTDDARRHLLVAYVRKLGEQKRIRLVGAKQV